MVFKDLLIDSEDFISYYQVSKFVFFRCTSLFLRFAILVSRFPICISIFLNSFLRFTRVCVCDLQPVFLRFSKSFLRFPQLLEAFGGPFKGLLEAL